MKPEDVDGLLAEQVAYYRARAPEYFETAVTTTDRANLSAAKEGMAAAFARFGPIGETLELACGTGTWTQVLARRATQLTAVDASPEMLEIASRNVGASLVRFVRADLFKWVPDRRYDVVFFAFWLSHVPLERFEAFWSLVDTALKSTGRVFFIDDSYRAADELADDARSTTIRRRLTDGTSYRAVKVPHAPAELEAELDRLGWRITVNALPGPFYWGTGSRAGESRALSAHPSRT